ncbi:MAG TPA: M20/M25/M40 family metallo-hydrolase [Planctomycetota bacterium]
MRRLSMIAMLLAGCANDSGAVFWRGYPPAQKIANVASRDEGAWKKLVELCDDVGHRLSGSKGLERAVEWGVATLKADGHENVRAEPVKVPKWVRGRESLALLEPREHPMVILGLGGSVGTPPEGITAEVVVVRDKAELDAIGDGAKGKIVLFNFPMPSYDAEKGSRYGETVTYRVNGAAWAAEKGAVAALVRSVTAKSLRTPHTGGMNYGKAAVKIPTAAITIEDAEMLARLAARGKKPVVRLIMDAKSEGEADSHNVIGELVGREKPDEIVIISGHLDSWDVGQGAHDDGAGCVIAMQALTTLRQLGLRPRRTIRVVLWTNEENGLGGARTYVKDHAVELKKHIAAIESDSGGTRPLGFTVEHADAAKLPKIIERLRGNLRALEDMRASDVRPGGSGADVGQLKEHGVACLGLRVDDSIYFDTHHTPADTVDKVNPADLAKCVAAMALAAYQIAEHGWEPEAGSR